MVLQHALPSKLHLSEHTQTAWDSAPQHLTLIRNLLGQPVNVGLARGLVEG